MYEISKNLISFENNLNILKNNFKKNKLSNSLIFYGNKGIGKATFTFFLINNFSCIVVVTQNWGRNNITVDIFISSDQIEVAKKFILDQGLPITTSLSSEELLNLLKENLSNKDFNEMLKERLKRFIDGN